MSEETVPQGMAMRLKFEWPGDVMSRYATNFVSQHTRDEFVLSFYEVLQPILVGTPESNKQQLEEMGSVPAHCVARIILSPSGMTQLIDILQRNQASFVEAQESEAE